MCFSATASFSASAVLTMAGVATIRKTETTSQKFLATIPLLFAVQQFMEGMVWLGLTNPEYRQWLSLASYSFLIFAWVIWPIYIPLSLRMIEPSKRSKKIIGLFLILGVVAAILLIFQLLFYNIQPQIDGSHIRYRIEHPFKFQRYIISAFYFIPIVVSLFVSSVNRMRYLGVIALLSFIVTVLFYTNYLISIWCFFAAIMSVGILWVVSGLKPGR